MDIEISFRISKPSLAFQSLSPFWGLRARSRLLPRSTSSKINLAVGSGKHGPSSILTFTDASSSDPMPTSHRSSGTATICGMAKQNLISSILTQSRFHFHGCLVRMPDNHPVKQLLNDSLCWWQACGWWWEALLGWCTCTVKRLQAVQLELVKNLEPGGRN